MRSFLASLFVLLIAWSADAVAQDAELLQQARETMLAARYAALVTVDDSGQPRARTVEPFVPEADFTVWIATRPVTRKVEQIRGNSRATLYYFDAGTRSYVTLMGRAELVTDPAILRAKRRPEDSERLYPNFPEDYLLIRVVPDNLEAIVPGYRGDPDNWQPARVEFRRTSP